MADLIRRRILRRELRPGQRLPSYRQLAAAIGVSVPTVQTAIHGLEALGLVEIRHGLGTFVRTPSEDRTLVSAAVRRAKVPELVELRAQLDIQTGCRAAARIERRASSASVELINLWAGERWRCRLTEPRGFVDNDVAFHASVAGIARSELDLTISLYGWLARRLTRPLMLAAGAMGRDDDLDEQHWTLVDALRERDGAEIRRLTTAIAGRERALTLDAVR